MNWPGVFRIDLCCVPLACTLWICTDASDGSRISQTGVGCQPERWGKNLLSARIFAENCMKMGGGDQWMRTRDSHGFLTILTFGIGICLCLIQWRIQDFQGRVANPKAGHQSIIWPNSPENCIELKKIGSGAHIQNFVYVDPPLLFDTWIHLILGSNLMCWSNTDWCAGLKNK